MADISDRSIVDVGMNMSARVDIYSGMTDWIPRYITLFFTFVYSNGEEALWIC